MGVFNIVSWSFEQKTLELVSEFTFSHLYSLLWLWFDVLEKQNTAKWQ